MDIFVPLPFLYDFFFCTQLPLFPRPPSTHWNLSNLRWQAIKQHRFPKIFFGEGQKISPIISINLYGAFQTTRDYRISLGWQLHHWGELGFQIPRNVRPNGDEKVNANRKLDLIPFADISFIMLPAHDSIFKLVFPPAQKCYIHIITDITITY